MDIGANFAATASLILVIFHKVTIEDNVIIGWNNTICDTDFHCVKLVDSQKNTNLCSKF